MDFDMWVALGGLLGVLLVVRAIVGKLQKKHKVLRVSERTIEASRGIAVRYLPMVEDNKDSLIDIMELPCDKQQIKSALKVMAYCFTRKRKHQDLARIKSAFVALHRFQDGDLTDQYTINAAAREKERLVNEIEDYLSKHFA
ncbi:hypothetical protein [Salidesulfovibrio onnuriiensis]|uniref:hypothetical protein n=1 Tax=Salidesulfovibrio onnuriiensis TaxID=2583823 RepID=UPI0011C86742|nr:hypothetical protein [Salidesulfovibrio onnuriiensis]